MRNILGINMNMLETGLLWLGGIAALGTLGYALLNIFLAQKRPTGQQTGSAQRVLRTPYLVIATLLFIVLGYLLWRPLPLPLPKELQLSLEIVGVLVMLPSLGLYIWGLTTLGRNFNASSGFGVRLYEAHQLVAQGPYAYLRHPMYLAVILACWGGLLLFRTWTMMMMAVIMFGLLYRARSEEDALALAFGAEWETYKRAVPGWLPRLKTGSKSTKHE